MTNNTNGISTDITIYNKILKTVCNFKYLGTIVWDEGSKPEVLSRIAQTTAAVTNGSKPEVLSRIALTTAAVTNEGSKPEVLSRIAQTTAAVTNEGSKPEVLSRIAQTTAAVTNEGSKPEVLSRIALTTAAVTNEGSKPEVLSRIALTTAAVTKLKVIWNNKNMAISSNIRLMHSLAMSIFLYVCETWTITQTLKEGYRHWRWDVSTNSWVSRTEITEVLRKWKPEAETPSGHMKTSWLHWKDANWSGTGTSHDHLDWPRLSYREQFKEEDEEADRGSDGKTASKSGLASNGISY